ncbi:hypothetical protein BKA70DRAFT_483570 [Coprinopsis sp. MPI-PUGE-AT-0042]|nr:hypothetical protein BKA70DRAFT_483570 [Coprinopsis sp. MPI-PUGE-AT-0042]
MEDPRQPWPVQSSALSMIKESGQVSVKDSNLTMAGGHVNHIAVSIALNRQPSPEPIPRSLWLRTLGEWLLGPQTRLIPPNPPLLEAPEGHALSPRVPLNNGGEDINNGIDIVPLEHLDIHAQLALTAAPVRMPHEIYVKKLYPRGHGYPCANPRPRGAPIKIGDIGLLASDRFKALQNLYNLPESFLGGHPVPEVPLICDPNIFVEGDTVTGGTDGCTVKMTKCQTAVDAFTFHCCQEEGAVLAITSPAELEEMEENDSLREYLCQHADRLFNFLVEKYRVPEGSSIYIVTGTITSASWATATYDSPMDPSYNSLVLKRVANNQTRRSFSMWTERGNAQTNQHDGTCKNQILFLRGFLMTASPAVWKARKALILRQAHPETSVKQDALSPTANETAGRDVSANGAVNDPNSTLCSLPSGSVAMNGVSIHSIPAHAIPGGDYPSYRVNQALLDFTDADFAITHENDWKEAIGEAATIETVEEQSEPALDMLGKVFTMHIERVNRVALLASQSLAEECRSESMHVVFTPNTNETSKLDSDSSQLTVQPLLEKQPEGVLSTRPKVETNVGAKFEGGIGTKPISSDEDSGRASRSRIARVVAVDVAFATAGPSPEVSSSEPLPLPEAVVDEFSSTSATGAGAPKSFQRFRSALQTAIRPKKASKLPVDEIATIVKRDKKGTKVAIRRSGSSSKPAGDDAAGRQPEERVAGLRGFISPSLRQASVSSPALHLPSQVLSTTRPQPVAIALSSSNADVLTSPRRPNGRQVSLQPPAVKGGGAPSRHRLARPAPLTIPPSPSTPALPLPASSQSPVSSRSTQLSVATPQSLTRPSLSPARPSSKIRTSSATCVASPSLVHSTSNTRFRASTPSRIVSSSTSHLPFSPNPLLEGRRTSGDSTRHSAVGVSPPARLSPIPGHSHFRPRARTPSQHVYSQNRPVSTSTRPPPPSLTTDHEHCKLLRNATLHALHGDFEASTPHDKDGGGYEGLGGCGSPDERSGTAREDAEQRRHHDGYGPRRGHGEEGLWRSPPRWLRALSVAEQAESQFSGAS